MKQTQIPLRVARLHRPDFNPTPSHSPPRARSPAGPAASHSRGWWWRRPPPRAVRIRQSAAGRWASQKKSLHARRVPNRAFRPAGWWRWGRMQTAQRVTRKVRGCEGRADSFWSFWTESCQESEFTDETSGRIHLLSSKCSSSAPIQSEGRPIGTPAEPSSRSSEDKMQCETRAAKHAPLSWRRWMRNEAAHTSSDCRLSDGAQGAIAGLAICLRL
jgi:hypothetical protein